MFNVTITTHKILSEYTDGILNTERLRQIPLNTRYYINSINIKQFASFPIQNEKETNVNIEMKLIH